MTNQNNQSSVEGWEELIERFERLELNDHESKGCTVTLAEYLKHDNVKIILNFIFQELQAKDKHYEDVIDKYKEVLEKYIPASVIDSANDYLLDLLHENNGAYKEMVDRKETLLKNNINIE